QPVPKVIDFGVAKAIGRLTERTLFTQCGQLVGTLEYMSPEQASFSAVDVDTRCDIYSVGVLLYELLTGSTPFDKERLRGAALHEVLRIIREEEPPRPSTRLSTTAELPRIAAHRRTELSRLSRLLKGDLDWIVMKALDKDPEARYATARELGDDLQRFLEDRPIKAKRPTVWQRLAKWSRRHRPLVASAVASLVAAVGVSGVRLPLRRP